MLQELEQGERNASESMGDIVVRANASGTSRAPCSRPAGRGRYSASRANEGKMGLARLNAPSGGTPRRAWRALRRGGGRGREALGDGDEGKDVGRSASNYYTR